MFSASGEDDEKGKWRIDKPVPESWPVKVDDVTMLCKLSGLWHLGLFPEQHPHWQWMLAEIAKVTGETPRVLNLFGYTGAASLLAAKAGAEVTHVDASKKAVTWAQRKSSRPRKWTPRKSAGSSMTPPSSWRATCGAAKPITSFLSIRRSSGAVPKARCGICSRICRDYCNDCAKLLAPGGAAMVLTVYAIRASALAFDQVLQDTLKGKGGTFDRGELAIQSKSGPCVPTSLFVRWSSRS